MRALPCLLACAAAAPAPPVPPPALPAAGVATLAPDAEARWVPFVLTAAGQVRFAMSVDGRPVSALLDTGVSVSVLARGWAAAAGAPVAAAGRAAAIGGAVATGWTATRRVVLGGLTRTGGWLSVATLPAAATGGTSGEGAGVDLLAGRDLLGGAALDIDFPRRRFRLLPSGRLPFAGALAPLRVSAERRVYESELVLAGRRLNPMVVDTGDGTALTVTAAAWRAAGLPPPPTTALAFGLGGPVVTGLAVVAGVRVGEARPAEAEVRVEPAGGFSDVVGAAGRIGAGFLAHYRVLLDPGAGRMVLAGDDGAPPLRSTTGLLLGVLPGRLRVLHVMRASPAALAGWRAGELICRIDGQAVPADYPASPLAGWSVAPPGTAVALELCGGGTRRLVARRFY